MGLGQGDQDTSRTVGYRGGRPNQGDEALFDMVVQTRGVDGASAGRHRVRTADADIDVDDPAAAAAALGRGTRGGRLLAAAWLRLWAGSEGAASLSIAPGTDVSKNMDLSQVQNLRVTPEQLRQRALAAARKRQRGRGR